MKLIVALVLFVLLLSLAPVNAEEQHQHFDSNEKLGTVSFPTSCAPSAQKPFERGVALLHSFWYDEANKQFQRVAEDDPKCAMADWGQAMSLYHQLWSRPDSADLKRAWSLLRKACAIGAKTPRERDYIEALSAFYRRYDKLDHEKRATAYAQAMEKVSQRYPDDHEASVFYALSLLASAPDHDTTLENPKKAIAILNKLFEQEPEHPGVAHYLIHAADNPQLAQLGLSAARRYAEIAPASPHAVHMPSHIFARLGLWQDDIQSNLKSVQVSRQHSGMRLGADKVHSMDFLEYASLQTGENSKAMEMVKAVAQVGPGEVDKSLGGYLKYARAHFPAMYALETHAWKDAVALSPPTGAEPHNQAITFWARAVGAGHLRDAATARAATAQHEAMVEATRKGKEAYIAKYMDTGRDEARAWLAFAEGKNDEALRLRRPVADRQDAEGKGEVELPAREMLADMLLEMGRPEQALAEYEKSLKTDPSRFNGWNGAAQAAEATHDSEKARLYYAQLLKNCENGERPELARVKTLIAMQ
jgi:tetratricopeptide (TPR) repeat protein